MNPVKLYVGNLPGNITEDELRRIFLGAGAVGSVKISGEAAGRSPGSAVVEMLRCDDASLAIEYLDGSKLDGHDLVVAYLTAAQQYAKESALSRVTQPIVASPEQLLPAVCN